MNRAACCLAPMLLVAVGCHHVRVEVDCRLTADRSLWHHLEGPAYVIRGGDEEAEASLSFEEFSGMLEHVLKLSRPDMKRAAAGKPARLQLALSYNVFDRGAGVEMYPVYGHYPGYMYGYGPHHRHGFHGVVATEARTVHLGYEHVLFVSAWIADSSQPAGRRVVWEGHCDHVSSRRSLKQTMPYLMVALASYYNQSTDRPVLVKFDRDDERVLALQKKSRLPGGNGMAATQADRS